MKKRYALIPISLIISLILAFSVNDNFSRYGGYYATQLPRGEGKHPELILIMKYLEHIPHPDNSQLNYDYDGTHTLSKFASHFLMGNEGELNLYYEDNRRPDDNRSHRFSHTGEYLKTTYYYVDDNPHNDGERSTPEDEAEAYELAYDIIQQLIDVQKAPPKEQNLQWLFNLIYQKQFE